MIKALFFNLFVRKFLLYSFGLVALVFSIVGIDLATYQQLTKKDSIYRISIYEVSPNKFDFHLLRFSSWLAMSGINYLYQPIRLSNRYSSISDQREKPLQFYSLRQSDTLDDWSLLIRFRHLLPIDAIFGASVFMPLENRAEYEIMIGFPGLVVKSMNNPAYSAVQNWQMYD
jgi:hypothetical protein